MRAAILAHIANPTIPSAVYSARAPPWYDAPLQVDPQYDPLAQPEPAIEFDQRIDW